MPSIREQLEPLIREVGVNEVARRAGIPPARLYDWFAGRRDLYAERLEAVAKAVGRPLRLRPIRRRGFRVDFEPRPEGEIVAGDQRLVPPEGTRHIRLRADGVIVAMDADGDVLATSELAPG